jgi:hypothetical protein
MRYVDMRGNGRFLRFSPSQTLGLQLTLRSFANLHGFAQDDNGGEVDSLRVTMLSGRCVQRDNAGGADGLRTTGV